MNDNLVNTFGGAVSHLERTFQTLNFPNNKKRITTYIKNNPDDTETKIAWNTYSEVMRNVKNEKHLKYRYVWKVEDKKTGEKFTTTSAVALGFKIGACKDTVFRYYNWGTLWNNRYKITRTRA